MVVESVEKKSPAEAAGLKSGDQIVAIGDVQVRRPLDFYRGLIEATPGEELAVSVRRGDETHTAELALAAPPNYVKSPVNPTWDLLGMELKPVPPQEFHDRFHTEYRGGLTVAAVRPQEPGGGARGAAGRRAGGDAHLGDGVAGERAVHHEPAGLRQSQPGQVLHPPRHGNALRLLPGEFDPAAAEVAAARGKPRRYAVIHHSSFIVYNSPGMESDFIAHLRRRIPPHPLVRLGPGDDAAVLRWPAAGDCVVTTDMLMDHVDFEWPRSIPAGRAARQWPSI